MNEQQSLTRFRRALRREDQRALDDLLGSSRRHLAAAAYASHLLPFEVMLLSMLVEEHKQVLRLRQELDVLQSRPDPGSPTVEKADRPGANPVEQMLELPSQNDGEHGGDTDPGGPI